MPAVREPQRPARIVRGRQNVKSTRWLGPCLLVEVCSNRGDVKRNCENITALLMRAFYFCLLWVTAMNTHARTATEASDGATSIQVATVDSKSAVLLGVPVLRQGINPANDPPIYSV